MIALACLAAVSFSSVHLEPEGKRISPRVTDAVAGLSVRGRKLSQALWVDRRKNVYAEKSLDCDGSHVWVYLGRDRSRLGNFSREEDHRAIICSTKHGIELGIAATALREKLGSPDKTFLKGRVETWRFFEKVDRKPNKFAFLVNDYTVKNGKVVAIEIGYEQVPGCGDTFDPTKAW